MSGDSEGQQTDFDSLFILNEEDKADLVAKQQQLSYIRRGEGGSGAGSPARGSPARRTQVRQWCSHAAAILQCTMGNQADTTRMFSIEAFYILFLIVG